MPVVSLIREAPNLDLLRSLAVSFVVGSHLAVVLGEVNEHNYYVQALGLLGVAIFFVHTCLVLMMSLDRQPRGPRAAEFLIRRVFRIYPLAIVVVLAVYMGDSAKPTGWELASNLLLIQNITGAPSTPAPLWSLPFEMQMYLFLPALYLAARTRDSLPWVGGLWLVSVALVLVAWRSGFNYHLLKYLPCFLPGVLAFALSHRSGTATLPPVTLFCFVLLCAAAFPVAVAAGGPETPLLWIVCLLLGLLIPFCAQIKTEWIARSAKILATYSYGIYLIHAECVHLAFVKLAGYPVAGKWIIFIGTTAGLSYVAHHLIEKPGIAWGMRLARIVRPLPASARAPVQ